MILFFDRLFAYATRACGAVASFAMVLLLLNVFYDVVMRYAFNDVSIGMQELEWHLFAVVFLLGTPYAMSKDGHVRVDIFYERLSDRSKAWINLVGSMLFVLPFIAVVAYYGIDFSYQAYVINEGSGDPGGLPYRWIIKALIPFSFALMGLAAMGMVTQALRVLVLREHYDHSPKEPLT